MSEFSNIPQFAELALPLPIRQTFTYHLPASFRAEIQIGCRLLVPFGNRNITGYVVKLLENLPENTSLDQSTIKDAIELLDQEPLVSTEILKLTAWTAEYYASSWGDVLKASLPAGVNIETEQIFQITGQGQAELTASKRLSSQKMQLLQYIAEVSEASIRHLEKKFGTSVARRVLRELQKADFVLRTQRALETKAKPKIRKIVRLNQGSFNFNLNPKQQEIVTLLSENSMGGIALAELIKSTNVSVSVIQTLKKKGILEIFEAEVLRDPFVDAKLPALLDLVLTDEQTFVLNEITDSLEKDLYQAFLLHGVTGSGKTEIYIRAMRKSLDLGKSALMLVPEIALTPVFSRRLRAVFGDDVAILHSNLSIGERYDEWRRIRKGAARVVIGTRSAIFAPLVNIGIIIVDEEHDGSYRQQESPFYSARDLAVVRTNFAGAVVVLGSATPSLESFFNAKQGKYRLISLPNRIGKRALAQAELIDMREVFRVHGKDQIISEQLLNAIEETYRKGEQTIILLNRRGFSQYVLCRKCGESVKCINCDITLTFHRQDNSLLCHYCGYQMKVPAKCPGCESKFIFFVGQGTEQIEDILQQKFSEMRIARVDRDSSRRRRSFEETFLDFSEHKIDMLVGTQMLAKGHDFPNVTLVGVISVDSGLALPDFRSAERTFQLLTQVAGRAGRGDLPGRVLIQTYHPEHYVLQHALTQNYVDFYNKETMFRRNIGYPPFVAIASILIHHPNYNYALENAKILKECLQNANSNRQVRILGPAPAPLARLRGEHRLQILIKSTSRTNLRGLLDVAFDEAKAKFCDMKTLILEIDPINLL